jgi:hypothetical protein
MSKKTKKYRPRPLLNPLNVRDPWKCEGDAHAALLAMESDTVEESHLAMLAAHADMVRRMFKPGNPERTQADTVIRIIAEIKSRSDIRVLPLEEVAIRAALQVTLPAIRNASNLDIYRAALAGLKDMDRLGGAMRVTL